MRTEDMLLEAESEIVDMQTRLQDEIIARRAAEDRLEQISDLLIGTTNAITKATEVTIAKTTVAHAPPGEAVTSGQLGGDVAGLIAAFVDSFNALRTQVHVESKTVITPTLETEPEFDIVVKQRDEFGRPHLLRVKATK